MRILIVSNFFPPHFLGGYELGCRDVADALERRGHEIRVLTSSHGVGRPVTDGRVLRWLHASASSTAAPSRRHELLRHEVANQRTFDRACRLHRPDVVHIWNLARLPISLAMRAEARGPVCYYVSDPWLAQWTEPGWYEDRWHRLNSGPQAGLATRLTRSAFGLAGLTWTNGELRLEHVQFCSAFLKNETMRAGRRVGDAGVVHWGVDPSRFNTEDGDRTWESRARRLLYVGQVLPHKGVHTAVEAVAQLHASGATDVTLTIAGASHRPDYDEQLRQQVTAHGLDRAVRFIGSQSRDRLPGIYREHGILVFPSCWGEPFAITPLEAMASGLAVVGTTAGGSPEIFEDGLNVLTFPQEDAAACAAQIRRLIVNADFAQALARRGRATVLERFTLGGMVTRIEARLTAAAAHSPVRGKPAWSTT